MKPTSRAERAAEADTLFRLLGNKTWVAEEMGLSRSYIGDLLDDPAGHRVTARKLSYSKPCPDCGRPMSGSEGPNGRRAPKRCKACADTPTAPHGTRSKYNSGCHCDDCRKANNAAVKRDRLKRTAQVRAGEREPPHGLSGYHNWGCRCEVCAQAHRVWMQSRRLYHQHWRDSKRGTEPPVHGRQSSYTVYGCRCAPCVDAMRSRWRKRAA